MSSGDAGVVRAEGIVKAFGTAGGPVAVLDGVDLSLRGGESLAVTGESGSGKSTLLHLIAGLDVADAGALTVLGTDLRAADDRARAALRCGWIGMIFQKCNLIPSVRDHRQAPRDPLLAGSARPSLQFRVE